MLSCIYSRTAERNCLKNPDGLHFGVSEVGKTRREAPLLPLCGTKDTQSRASSYLPNSFRRFIPGNRTSRISHSRKPGGFSGTTRVDKSLPKRPNIFLNCSERLVQVVPLNEHTYIVTFRVGLCALLQTLQSIPHQLCFA